MPCEKCIYEKTIEELKERQDKYELRNGEKRGELYKRITELERGSTRIDTQYQTIADDMKEVKQLVKELTDKPTKRWETVIGALIGAIVGGLVAVFFK